MLRKQSSRANSSPRSSASSHEDVYSERFFEPEYPPNDIKTWRSSMSTSSTGSLVSCSSPLTWTTLMYLQRVCTLKCLCTTPMQPTCLLRASSSTPAPSTPHIIYWGSLLRLLLPYRGLPLSICRDGNLANMTSRQRPRRQCLLWDTT